MSEYASYFEVRRGGWPPGEEVDAMHTVLVFDDEEDLRDIMCRMLQRKGFNAMPAAEPADAVAVCREYDGEIDVLLADLGMPDAVGVDLAREATAIRPGLRVLYVTGLPKDAAVRQGIVDEGALVMQKPFTTDGLLSAVNEALRAPAGSHAAAR
ncbi:MAG TPA: response regulator [Micromonosporaceae bacterium]|nr:response regulator [Micromonosporaceae bacterium]